MKIPDTWLNVGNVVQVVKKGDLISIEVQGGFIRAPAPCSGWVIEDRNQVSMFVPRSKKKEST